MSSKPRRGSFGPSDQAALLESLRKARDSVLLLSAAISPSSERYRICGEVTKTIDTLAGDLTGDRTYYHAKPHGGGFGRDQ